MLIGEAIQGFILDRKVRNRSADTIDWYKPRLNALRDFLTEQGVQQIESVTTHHLRAFVVHLQGMRANERNDYKPTSENAITPLTLHGYVRAFKAFFAWCYQEEILTKDPSVRIERPKVPHYLIPSFKAEHLAAMFDACDLRTALGFRDYTLLLVLLDTGIRLGELCGLKIADVHDTYLVVFGKGGKQREVGIGPTTANAIWKYINKFRKAKDEDEEHVFLGRWGEPFRPLGVYEVFRMFKQKAGIEGVRCSPHTLRHTMARMWLENGGEVFNLSRVLGHTSVTITQEYLKEFQSRQAREEQAQYSPVESLKKQGWKRGRPPKKKAREK
jgi:integrase/recombinase XerD